MIRASTLEKIVQFAGLTSENAPLLSDMMRQSLTSDVIKGVLNDNHLMALDRRVRAVAIIVFDCINRTLTETGKVDSWRQVVLDDGF
jgi:Golgi casein kinase, C-terminal, Fam20